MRCRRGGGTVVLSSPQIHYKRRMIYADPADSSTTVTTKDLDASTKLAIWFLWAVMWRTVVFSLPFSFFGGLVGFMVASGVYADDALGERVASVTSALPAIVIQILVIRAMLNARFGDVRVTVVAAGSPDNVARVDDPNLKSGH